MVVGSWARAGSWSGASVEAVVVASLPLAVAAVATEMVLLDLLSVAMAVVEVRC